MREAYNVRDEAPVSYFTMIPHKVDDAGLSAYAMRLYIHLKRVAGDKGQCWQSQGTLAKFCNMSNRTVVGAKRELVSQDLITIKLMSVGGHPQHVITIVDIWKTNDEVYRCTSAPDFGVHQHPTSVHIDTSKNTPKKNTPKKNTYSDAVLLTDVEYEKLITRFGKADAQRRINNLELYMKSKGIKYKSHYHTILNWARMDRGNGKNRGHDGAAGAKRLKESVGKPLKARV